MTACRTTRPCASRRLRRAASRLRYTVSAAATNRLPKDASTRTVPCWDGVVTSVAGAVSVGSAGWKSVVGRSVAAPGPFWRGIWVEGRSCEEDMVCVCVDGGSTRVPGCVREPQSGVGSTDDIIGAPGHRRPRAGACVPISNDDHEDRIRVSRILHCLLRLLWREEICLGNAESAPTAGFAPA